MAKSLPKPAPVEDEELPTIIVRIWLTVYLLTVGNGTILSVIGSTAPIPGIPLQPPLEVPV